MNDSLWFLVAQVCLIPVWILGYYALKKGIKLYKQTKGNDGK